MADEIGISPFPGGVLQLNPNMLWVERFAYSPVIQQVKSTLDGSPVIYTRTTDAGRPITLIAIEDQGWLTTEMVEALQLSARAPGAVFTLTIGDESFSVVFRHHEPPAVSMRPLIPRSIPEPGDYFIGELKFMTV